jgi:uncharacterized protein with PIN domain
MDENVEGAITRQVRLHGVDVLTAQEDGRSGEDDPPLLDRAGELGRVIFSRDDDLLREATKRQHTGVSFPGVIYAHQLRVSIGQCVTDLTTLAQQGEPDQFVDRVRYLPLR